MVKNSTNKKLATLEAIALQLSELKVGVNKRFDNLATKKDLENSKDEIINTMARSFENEHEYFDREFREVKNIAEKVSKYDKKVDSLFESFSLDHKRT